ncbi:galactose-1-phosphate uridylyltransferase [Candidatus Woesearchaeota archaeon]|nr:galactose-1-phosphate uridylyltransferase [Candidatus Woesearchaeota archaeon]
MGELRKDYILDRWVIIASERGKRPHQFAKSKDSKKISQKDDFFAPGNEDMTPPEIMRVENRDPKTRKKWPWKIRVFPNKFSAVRQKGNPVIRKQDRFHESSSNYGKHEVIAETPDKDKQLWDLGKQDIKGVIDVYCRRIQEIGKIKGIKYVCVFKNSGREAGTSILHSHSQVIGYNKVPEIVEQKAGAAKGKRKCPYCEIISREMKTKRKCFNNKSFSAFTPYASRFPFEIWIFPKKHRNSIVQLEDSERKDLAEILQKVLRKLKKLNAPFNYAVYNSPAGKDLHFHIEVLPRLATWAGFEMFGTVINTMPPEEAAKFYRGN